ncbi:MAG: beta-ketoacyl reductase [Cyanobacteriota bacterium]
MKVENSFISDFTLDVNDFDYKQKLLSFCFYELKKFSDENISIRTSEKIQFYSKYDKNLKIKIEKIYNKYNINITNKENEKVLDILGLKNSYIVPDSPEDWIYHFSYVEKNLSLKKDSNLSNILVLDDNTGIFSNFSLIFDERKICYVTVPKNDLEILDKNFIPKFDTILYFSILEIKKETDLDEIKNKCEQEYKNILKLLKYIEKNDFEKSPRLYFITNGAKKVSDIDTEINYLNSIVHGFNKVINYEYPKLNATTIDLSYNYKPVESMLLFEEINSNSDENDIVIRNDNRYVSRFIKGLSKKENYLKPEQEENTSFFSKINSFLSPKKEKKSEFKYNFKIDSEGIYLITGGLGGLGLVFADFLIEKGAKKLVLTNRSGIKNDEIKEIVTKLKNKADIHIITSDISNKNDTKLLFQKIKELGILKGVIHSAGILDEGIINEQNIEKFNKVMNPKAYALINLHNETLNLNIDFFINFSSLKSQIGLHGHPNYSIANSFLDIFSFYRRSKNLPSFNINWCPWKEIGLAVKYDDIGILEKQGIYPINPKQALAVIDKVIINDIPDISIFSLDLTKFFKSYPIAKKIKLFENIIKEQKIDINTIITKNSNIITNKIEKKQTKDTIYDKKETNSFSESELTEILKKEVALILKMPTSKIDEKTPLVNYGFDSLMAIELSNNLEDKYQIIFNPIILKEKNSIELLCDFFVNNK